MTPIQERHQLVELIEEAVRSGARKSRACSEARVCVRTLQRWQIDSGKVKEDARSKALRPEPVNKLHAVEVQAVLDVCNTPELGDRGGNLCHLVIAVGARIAGIGQQFGYWPLLDFTD